VEEVAELLPMVREDFRAVRDYLNKMGYRPQ